MKMKGRLLNFGRVDCCGRMFSGNCKISFPNEVPITINFEKNSDDIIGYGKITKDDTGLEVDAEIIRDDFNEPEYNVGGFYTNVKSHYEPGILVIDECKLISASLVYSPADKDLVIRRYEMTKNEEPINNDTIITVDCMLEYLQKMKDQGFGNCPVTINGRTISRTDGYYNCKSGSSARFNIKY